jgi:hypothetical protein
MNSPNEHFVEVRVVTTAGVFPVSGFDREPADQPVKVILKRAQTALRITDTMNWIAVVGGRRIDPELSYEKNRLEGRVEIDWGPDHGGGGNA